ncbi:CapA family protein [Massilia sp. GCM10020059]|uniref:CapA family protein n=1 Tax=Massilia agrisoli TaxID=2892444 RepID=A0ABS8IM96_9BURK|nr:CapA family protein [Massilia agrisoli]MCC6069489.1 CapA family protein [Massilia agrisoli]
MATGTQAARPPVRVVFGGDVMLGRTVAAWIRRFGPHYPLKGVARQLRDADLAVVNLECAITESLQRWKGEPKAFYFGAPLAAVNALSDAGIDLVSLANNHILDYEFEGLADTLWQLHAQGIANAGAGADIGEALAPAVIERKGSRFAMVAMCDHQADFAATPDRPGMAYIDFADESEALDLIEKVLAPVRNAGADWPILSLHWGPNMVPEPSPLFRRIAHAAIEMGWKILFGHSAHIFQGIEFYRGCPILYAAGDLVDDYAVDPVLRNDHQLLYDMEIDNGAVQRILLHPVFIGDCQARPATGAQFDFIARRITALSDAMGTKVNRFHEKLWIDAAPARAA